MVDFLESDLYEPVMEFLKKEGYEVKGEVKNCDVVAYKDNLLTVVELKKAFNLKLVYQAIDRQDFANFVYVAIGRDKKGMKNQNFKSMVKLLKRLDIGLITVALDSPIKTVEIVLQPLALRKTKSTKKRTMVNKEFNNRTTQLNKGGVNKTKIITAYRELSIELLCVGKKFETLTYKQLKEMGYDKKVTSILYKNYYGWFEKVGKAEYIVSNIGKEALLDEKYNILINYYEKEGLFTKY